MNEELRESMTMHGLALTASPERPLPCPIARRNRLSSSGLVL